MALGYVIFIFSTATLLLTIIVNVMYARALRTAGPNVKVRAWHVFVISVGFLSLATVAVAEVMNLVFPGEQYVVLVGLVLSSAALGILGNFQAQRMKAERKKDESA